LPLPKKIITRKGTFLRNQPQYHFLKNTRYALKGLLDLIKTEISFKIELILVFLLLPVVILIDTSLTNKLIMFITLIGMLLTEAMNSAIERVVDLVTLDHHEMAGRAKDVGSAAVFISILIFCVTWMSIIFTM
jgi:diacylglycerol kinase (ATP)